jgi:uncharacterized protein YjbI with pentapeptide repeats
VADEFSGQDLSGARFHWVDLSGASFDHVRLAGARLQQVDLTNVTIRAARLDGLDISGDVGHVRINDVEIAPLIEAELDRRHPERAKLRPTDAQGYREAWPVIEQLWAATVDRARRLDPDLLHQRVEGEWSFIETQRHLLFATDAWIGRVLLGEPSPWHPLDLPFDEMPDTPGVPRDREARPTLDEVLGLRDERMAIVAQVLADLTDDQLAGSTEPVDEPGWPRPDRYPVRGVLDTILDEEWWHHRFANRDLDRLTAPAPA